MVSEKMTKIMGSDEDLFKKGVEYHNKGDFDKAILFYKKFLETFGLDKKILVLLGNAYYETKKFKEAENAYKKALTLDPNYSMAYFNLGILYEHAKKFDKAIEAYKRATELDTGFAEAYVNLGDLYKAARDLDSAIVCYKKALEIDGGNQKAIEGLKYIPDYLIEKAEKRELINKSDELIRKGISLEKREKAEEAVKNYREALKLYPDSASGFFLLKLSSSHLPLVPREELRFIKLKTSLICDSISPEAREYLGKRLGNIEFEPRIMENFFEAFKTKVAYQKEESVDLLKISKTILFEEPKESLSKTLELELKGDLEGAKKGYKEVLEKAPYLTHVYYLFGLFLELSGNENEALELYRQASRHSFDYLNEGLRADIAEIFSARPGYGHLKEKDIISILKEFHDLTAKDESISLKRFIKYKLSLEVEAKIKYGFEKEESGASVEAINAYEDAINIDPSNPIGHYVLGLAYETRGLSEEAMAEYEKTKYADFAGLESSEDIPKIIGEYLSKTTKDGHRVGTILSRYFEIIAEDPEHMLELLAFIEDLNIEAISKIIKSYISTDMIMGGKGKVVRDQLDFGGRGKLGIGGKKGIGAEGKVVRDLLDFGEHLDEEEGKIEKAKSVSKISFELLWKYKTQRSIRCEAITSDGRKILAGSENGIVYFIEQTAESPWRYESGSGIVDIDISPEGNFGVFCNSDGVIELLDCTQKGKPLWKKYLGQSGVNSVAISSSADLIAIATNDFKIRFLDREGEEKKTQTLNQIITKLDISDDGNALLAASKDGLFLIEGERQPIVLDFKTTEHIQSIAFSKAGGLISVGTWEGSVYLLESNGQVLWKNDLLGPVYGVAVSRDGKVAAGTMNGMLVLYSRQGELLWEYRTRENIWDVNISVDGGRIISGCGLVFGNIYFFSMGKEDG